MDRKSIGLFGAVIAGGLAIGWMLGGDSGAAAGSPAEPTSSEPAPAPTSATNSIWPVASSAAPGPSGRSIEVDASNPDFTPSARAKSMAETARIEAPEPAPALAAAPPSMPPSARPAPAPVAAPRPNGGWGVQAGVPPSTGPMAPPASPTAPRQPAS